MLRSAAFAFALVTTLYLRPYSAAAQETRPDAAAPQRPTLTFADPAVQRRIGTVYDAALHNLLDVNSVSDPEHKHDPLGRFATPPGKFIRAGGGYDTPWTRDASINSWAAGSLLEPLVARNTLWAVCQSVDGGDVTVQRDNQWWDQVVWVTAAWQHYCVTGDRAFLEQAYPVAVRTLADRRRDHFNERFGLFTGPAFFADGIAAYPAPEFDPANGSSFVLDYPHTSELMVLSTNCLYANAYRRAADMARALGRPAAEADALGRQADATKDAINQHLWSKQRDAYAYFLHGGGPKAGEPFFAQEGSGLAFALLFDVADAGQRKAVLDKVHVGPRGIVTLWPHLERFGDERPGRHNAMVWPLVNGLWACAAAHAGAIDRFAAEVRSVADLVTASDLNFYEIYEPRTGKPDGGWQAGHAWDPVPDQTWSATTYLAAVYRGLFGMSFAPDGLTFRPTLPAAWGDVTLSGLRYRAATLDVKLTGSGSTVRSVTLDGRPLPDGRVPAMLTGAHAVVIEMQ